MPPKGSKIINQKRKQINNLEHSLSRKRKRIEELNQFLNKTKDVSQNVSFPILTVNAAKRRKKNPTNQNLSDLDREGEMKHLLQLKLSTVLQMKTSLLHWME